MSFKKEFTEYDSSNTVPLSPALCCAKKRKRCPDEKLSVEPSKKRRLNQEKEKVKIKKSNKKFKQHEREIMNKRIEGIIKNVNAKINGLWNKHFGNKQMPNSMKFVFTYHEIEQYLDVTDKYDPEQHKDNKQKWWNNQKASEMAKGFLPAVLHSTDRMTELFAMQIADDLKASFADYARFVLLHAAMDSTFSTMRSGSNEVFLKTSFQYAKSGLRKKLNSYFNAAELLNMDSKACKKKENWMNLIQTKMEKLLKIYESAKGGIYQSNVCVDHTHYSLFTQQPVNICTPPRIYEVHKCHDCMQKKDEIAYWKAKYEELLKVIGLPQQYGMIQVENQPILNDDNGDWCNDGLIGFNQLIMPMIQQQQHTNNNCLIPGLNY